MRLYLWGREKRIQNFSQSFCKEENILDMYALKYCVTGKNGVGVCG